jgi:hypothetical protein
VNIDKIKEAEQEAFRLLSRIESVKKCNGDDLVWGCKHTAALRRASLDLTRALAEMRKP